MQIAAAPPVKGGLGLGWLTHYAVGVAYACLLVGLQGMRSVLNHTVFGAGLYLSAAGLRWVLE